MKALERHKDQHELQRRAVQIFAEECEAYPGVCLVYEDFVNLYESDGDKMLNLMMVLVFWDPEAPNDKGGKGAMREEYHDTFCRGSLHIDDIGNVNLRGSADNCVYRDVWLTAFQTRPDLFQNRFHTFIKTGDNGSSLKSHETFYFHSVLMSEYHVRIFYWTLCPNHAENRCDPAGARSKRAIKKYEIKTGEKSGNAEETANARNHYKDPKSVTARFTESILEYNKYSPESLIRRKPWFWAYSLKNCCVAFLQVTDIHENNKDPIRTIEVGAAGFMAPTEKHPFGVVDLRWESRDLKKVCMGCSKRFRRGVPRKDHNQKGFYLCPKTNVYTRETDESLDRVCLHCNEKVRNAHTESPHQSDDCPTEKLLQEKKRVFSHDSFSVLSINGRQRYPIYKDPVRKVTADDFPLEKIEKLASRFQKNPQPKKYQPLHANSVRAAKMMAPGLYVAYKLDAKKAQAHGRLSWGIGVCQNVKKDTFRVKVLAPSDPAVTVAPWGTWQLTSETEDLLLSGDSWIKILKLDRYNKLHTQTLHKIRGDGRFGWEWISKLDMAGTIPDPNRIEIYGGAEEEQRDT